MCGPGPVQRELRVTRGRAVRDQPHGQRGGMRWKAADLDVQNRGQPTQPLSANAKGIDPFGDFQPHLVSAVLRSMAAQLVHVDGIVQSQLRQFHRLVGGAADPDAKNAGRAPSRAQRG